MIRSITAEVVSVACRQRATAFLMNEDQSDADLMLSTEVSNTSARYSGASQSHSSGLFTVTPQTSRD